MPDARNRQNSPSGHHRTTSSGLSSQLRHVLTTRKGVKQQYLSHISSQNGELWPTNGWDLQLASLGYPIKFQQVSRLGSVTARYSSSRRQPNFVALNRGRHLYSAGRPSRWALAHILVSDYNSRVSWWTFRPTLFVPRKTEMNTLQRTKFTTLPLLCIHTTW